MFDNTALKLYNKVKNSLKFQQKLVWVNVLGISVLHILFIYSLLFYFFKLRLITFLWGVFVGQLTAIGVSCGAHRLWTHRAYKATLPLRIFLMLCYTTAGQYSLVQWARDHRLHHKCTDTTGDPHNANRGFFFSHCGWLMMKRHPDVKEKGKTIDLSDLWEDPVVRFHQKYYFPLMLVCFVILPSAVPMLCWNENLSQGIMTLFIFRYCLQLNLTWTVNSFAHIFGTKPYNKNMLARQNPWVSFFSLGEGWHNYHHVFPWDYRIGEFGQGTQTGAAFIELCAKLGLAYDLKFASIDMISKVINKSRQNEKQKEIEHAY